MSLLHQIEVLLPLFVCGLIYHVSRHCPPVGDYFRETTAVIEGLKKAPDSPETREQIRSLLHELHHKARPHYLYYSV